MTRIPPPEGRIARARHEYREIVNEAQARRLKSDRVADRLVAEINAATESYAERVIRQTLPEAPDEGSYPERDFEGG